jgi:hypothetical protein
MNQEYWIGSVKDFLGVPPELIDACLLDFREWLRLMRDKPGVFASDGFTWINDGTNQITLVDIVGSDGMSIARAQFREPL